MGKKLALLTLLLPVVLLAGSVSVDWSLIPANGNLVCVSGDQTGCGYGYTLTNNTSDYAYVTNLALVGISNFTIVDAGLTFGDLQLINVTNIPFLLPSNLSDPAGLGYTSNSITSPFDGTNGLIWLPVSPSAPAGANDSGQFQLSVQLLSWDPANGLVPDGDPFALTDLPFSVTVAQLGSTPEPAPIGLLGAGLAALAFMRRRMRPRDRR